MEKMTRKDFLRASFGGMAALAAVGVAGAVQPAQATSPVSLVNTLFNVAEAALEGDGSEISPWSGWEMAVNELGDACSVYFPKGFYTQVQTLRLRQGWRVYGDGRRQSIIRAALAGDALLSSFPVNSSNTADVEITRLGLECLDPAASLGAGITDVCGSLLNIHDIRVAGFRYGIILDQSEQVTIENCELGGQTGCLWLVSGSDHTPGAQGGLTNRITVARCHINSEGLPGCYGIIDDGGYAHTFSSNNFNGCKSHIYIAGTVGAVIESSEFEGSSHTPIIATYLAFHHQDGSIADGPNINLTIRDNVIIPPEGKSSVAFNNTTPITLVNNLAYGSPAFTGMANCHTVIALGNYNADGAIFDTTPKRLLALNGAPADEMYLHTSNLQTSGMAIGGGATITRHLSGTRSWSPPVVGNGGATWVTLLVPGAVVGDTVAVGFSRPVPGGALLSGAVTATAVVTITLLNMTGKLLELGSGTLRADLWRH